MKRVGISIAVILFAVAFAYVILPREDERTRYERYLNEHPFTQQLEKEKPSSDGEEETDRPDLAMMQDFLRTMDPTQLRPTPEVLEEMNTQMARVRDYGVGQVGEDVLATSISQTQWAERGPVNVGGRTRAILFDPSDNKKVWAGGVSGGLWFNNDITSAASQWQKVSDFWDNLAITCIAADPTNPLVFYVGTGEGWFNLDLVVGGGIWKTTDGGATWSRLASTSGFVFVNDIVVKNEAGNGVVYAAVQGGFTYRGLPVANNGLQRSTNGGTNWSQVLPASINDQFPVDIELASDGKIFVGARTDASGQASIYTSTNGTTWTTTNFNFDGRVEIATAPSNASVAYAMFVNNDGSNDIIAGFRKTTDGGTSWSTDLPLPDDADNGIPNNDFGRGQGWYDLILAVHPTNADMLFAGAINLFRTTNNGTNWTQISKWSNNANMNTLTVPIVHADHHQILFRPGFPNEAVIGNDGGVYYSSNMTLSGASLSIVSRNANYNVTQFYSGAIHPTVENYMLGGTQDNGSQKFTLAGLGATTEANSGDGGMCFIDELSPSIQIVSYVRNDFKLSTNGGLSFNIQLLDDLSTGNFINTADYDSKLKILFTAKSSTALYRVRNVTTTPVESDLTVNMGASATAIRVSPFPTSATNLYVGTQSGRLFKVLNAHNTPTVSEITGPSFPTGAISSIAFGETENQMLVTFSNYGIVSVWETRDGGANWSNKEGNLPNMPVRWAIYHHLFFDQVYLATELGVWSTDDISQATPVWNSTNGGLANVRTDMLRIKKNASNDGVIMAATHGRGVYTALVPSELDQLITFGAITAKTFGDPTFALSATASSGLTVSFASSDPTVVSLSGSVATIHKAGQVTITATQDGNIQYKAAPPVQQILTVNKASQTISFAALAEKTIIDLPFTVSATSSSNGVVTFASSNPAVATVSGNTITIIGTGTTNITASQPGNENFEPAPNVVQVLTVVSRVIALVGNLDFGEVIVGEEKQLTFQVENQGTAPLSITGINYPSGYTGTSQATANAITVTVTFKPTSAADFDGEITVNSNATSGDNTINANGTGVLITQAEDPNTSIQVYPNPVTTSLVIEGVSRTGTVLFTSGRGQMISMPVVARDQRSVTVDVSRLAAGTYVLAIPLGQSVIYRKILKQ